MSRLLYSFLIARRRLTIIQPLLNLRPGLAHCPQLSRNNEPRAEMHLDIRRRD